ncbi:protein PSK SIMULATOR 1-like [Bidens hawaiensis]|uniref:protein PSK SIMULATOR 1-like n=1 Tax=Bidens hawaiensis TaxID=980011 RepID=UPI00404B45B7
MVLETWLIKVKKTISQTFDSVHVTPPTKSTHVLKKSRIRVLAFEVAGIMRKLTDMWRSLTDESVTHLHNNSICLQGVRKIVSNKDTFLINLACAEMVDNIRVLGKYVSRLSKLCEDASLGCFETAFDSFANMGHDPYGWIVSLKDMEVRVKKMERYVAATATLYKEMDYDENVIKNNIKKGAKMDLDIQEKLHWQDQEIKYLKDRSLWNKSFDGVTLLLATSIFTILARIKLVFGIVNHEENNDISQGFFETYSKMLKPSSNTLGYAALSLHYANLIIVMEKMIRSPQLVGLDARDDLYSMLPNSIRSSLRGRLKGIGFVASDPVLAGEWREALGKILGWLSPLAHNMIKWQNERSFEHQNLMPKTNVLLLQTLFFANRMKTEAAITELLVGLNYIWRFEREMNHIIPAK